MPSLLERLQAGEVLISDGATGTYLQQRGLEPGGCPEEFNASHPEVVQGMARDYFHSGSDMVLTNSFGGSRFMQKKYGYEGRVAEFNRLAASHAASQKPDSDHYVLGSVGPTGEMMEPLPDGVSESEMYDALAEQVTALADGGADAILIETQMALEEAVTGIRAAKSATPLPVFATMVFDLGPRGFFTMMGVTPERAVTELREAGADVVGANCGNGIDRMLDLAALDARRGRRTHAHPLQRRHPRHERRPDHLQRVPRIHGRTLQAPRRHGHQHNRRLLRHRPRPHPRSPRRRQMTPKYTLPR